MARREQPASIADGAFDIASALVSLDERVRRLEEGVAAAPPADERAAPAGAPSRPADTAGDDPFWALAGLRERVGGAGAVLYTGTVETGDGAVEYQWGRPVDHLLTQDWSRAAARLAALGHPVRLEILRLLLNGERSVGELVDELELGSTGVAYHHLAQLEATGWVVTTGRGRRAVPPSRVVAILAAVLATEEG